MSGDDLAQCTNPRCFREAPLTTPAYLPYWEDELEDGGEEGLINTPVCVACYLAMECAAPNTPNEMQWNVEDRAALSESDVEELLNA